MKNRVKIYGTDREHIIEGKIEEKMLREIGLQEGFKKMRVHTAYDKNQLGPQDFPRNGDVIIGPVAH